MHFSTLFFDLDATLYPASNGLWDQIRYRIYQFMEEEIGIPEEEIPATRDHYWKTYGTTLEGLRIHHQVKAEDYLQYVHDLPLKDYLEPDPKLYQLLHSLPQDLWVFTNADTKHAERVLSEMGIFDLFMGIVDLFALDFVVKPNPLAYHRALQIAGEVDPTRCVLFDDMLPNLLTAKDLGFFTTLVGQNGHTNQVDIQLESIHEIKEKMPQLWV
jgi:putative hydrolase of the HAD superfamily